MSALKLIGISFGSVLLVVVLVIVGMNRVPNLAIGYEERVLTAQSDIQIQEKRRVDLIYNLVDTVKNYDKHEAETLIGIVEARSAGKGDIGEVTTMINAAAEAYPELKSNENYKELMNELSVTENMIAQHRTNYNKQVQLYNGFVKKFPNKEILAILGYEVQSFEYLNYDAPSTAPQNLFD